MTSQNILALANPLLSTIFAAVFYILWLRDRRTRWIAVTAVAYLANAIGFSIFHFAPDADNLVSIGLMHCFYSLTAAALVAGVSMRGGQSSNYRLHALISVIALGMMVAAAYGNNFDARLYAANASYGLIMALGAQAAARKPRRDLLDNAALALLSFSALQFFVRPLAAIMADGGMTADSYRNTPFYAIMVIILAISSLLMAMTLLMAALTDQMRVQRVADQRDPLTGLPSRGPFEEEAIEMLERSREDGIPSSLIVADIDHFKAVNDTFGHQMGDHAIAAFGRVLARQIRAGDRVGRIGGEEFCVVARNCDDRAAEAMAQRIREALSTVQINGLPEDLRLTASFGVAEQHGDEGYGKLFARADAALYRAKDDGRDCVRVNGKPENLALFPARARPKNARV